MLKQFVIFCFIYIVTGQGLIETYNDLYQKQLTISNNTRSLENIALNCSHVFIVAGGSTAANTAQIVSYNITDNVLMWNNTLPGWQPATTTLSGSTGDYGSPWVLFGSMISKNLSQYVCLIGIAQSGCIISDWHPATGKYFPLLKNAVDLGKKYGKVHILWQEGETDSSFEDYTDHFIRYLYDIVYQFQELDWFIAQTSYNPFHSYYLENHIRDGQSYIVSVFNNTFAGPNTDSLCSKYRYDNFHFNKYGVELVAEYWYNSFINKSKNYEPGHCNNQFITINELFNMFIIAFGIIALFMACCLGCFYTIRENNYHNQVYYYLVSNNNEKQHLLSQSF